MIVPASTTTAHLRTLPARGRRTTSTKVFKLEAVSARRIGRVLLHVLPFVLVAVCAISLREKMPAAALSLRNAQPIAFATLALFFVWNHFATLSWRALLQAAGAGKATLGQLTRLRIEAQAVNQLIPTAGLAGEALRAVAAADRGEVGAASLATVMDNVAGTMSGVVFAAFAIVLHVQATAGRDELLALAVTAAPAMLLLLAVVVLPFHLASRWSASPKPSFGALRRWLTPFAENGPEMRQAFRRAVCLRSLERVVSAGEVFVVYHAVGVRISAADAAFISAVFVLVSFSVFFIPGQLGAAEAAVASASTLIGVPASLGLSAALLRRARQLVVCVLGVVLLSARRFRVGPMHAGAKPEEAQ
jgi:uncharacterized membrane protein YbhN (UPF0104 family)